MKIKELVHEDYVNYKKPSLFLGMCECDWKCCREDSACKCQNASIAKYPIVDVLNEKLISAYLSNPLTHAVVIAGLEPILQWDDVVDFISDFRRYSDDDIVIYTGYYPDEIRMQIERIAGFKNIIVKFGRFKTGRKAHYDKILGVELANDEQFARKI